ncbi:T6SS phospholipase effector Tle1-like catalytic domain-containing protein [Oxalobacteraceae bacterium A2-2]
MKFFAKKGKKVQPFDNTISGSVHPPEISRKHYLAVCDASNCELNIELGIFFDGTGNNLNRDIYNHSESNIAKLYQVYSSSKADKVYVPGVGTEFPEIGEIKKLTLGAAIGKGGQARIIYGLLSLINSVFDKTLSKVGLSSEEILALCSPGQASSPQKRLLTSLGTAKIAIDGETLWLPFLHKQTKALKEALAAAGKPVIKECVLDVFGFSRGAAEARVFCNWLLMLTEEQQFAGIPIRIRFLGLFDTVAAVGTSDGISGAVLDTTGGHGDWAQSKHLRIPAEVENCVHMVAMHELRRNFPLDEVTVDGVLPPNCTEVAYPGSHSDVGGGYAPGELGVSKEDSLKLSQIPLNHMFECAVAAGVPLSRELDPQSFAISPELAQAYRQFLACSPPGPQRISDWTLPYLVWRWQQRHNYAKLDHVRNASEEDRKHLLEANAIFVRDGERMKLFGDEVISEQFVSDARSRRLNLKGNVPRQEAITYLEAEAWELRNRVLAARPVEPELGAFFDHYVHDSLAGFRSAVKESTGHWRYRRKFQGYDQPLLSQNPGNNAKAA